MQCYVKLQCHIVHRRISETVGRLSECWNSLMQEIAADVLFYTAMLTDRTLQALTLVCLSPAYPPSLAQRVISVVQHAFQAGRVRPDIYLSFLATLLVGRSSQVDGSLLDQGFGRAGPVVGSASRALQSYPDGPGGHTSPSAIYRCIKSSMGMHVQRRWMSPTASLLFREVIQDATYALLYFMRSS